MNHLPFDIISLPLQQQTGFFLLRDQKNMIQERSSSSGTELQVFRHSQKVNLVMRERVVFEFGKPASNTFEAADIGWEPVNPRRFVPAQVIIQKNNPIFHYKSIY